MYGLFIIIFGPSPIFAGNNDGCSSCHTFCTLNCRDELVCCFCCCWKLSIKFWLLSRDEGPDDHFELRLLELLRCRLLRFSFDDALSRSDPSLSRRSFLACRDDLAIFESELLELKCSLLSISKPGRLTKTFLRFSDSFFDFECAWTSFTCAWANMILNVASLPSCESSMYSRICRRRRSMSLFRFGLFGRWRLASANLARTASKFDLVGVGVSALNGNGRRKWNFCSWFFKFVSFTLMVAQSGFSSPGGSIVGGNNGVIVWLSCVLKSTSSFPNNLKSQAKAWAKNF